MRMKQRARDAAWLVLGLTVGVILFATCSCARPQPPEPETPSVLVVKNGYFNDVRMWVVRNGNKERTLGTVAGRSAVVFVLRRADMSDGTLQTLAISFLDGQSFLSERIALVYGQSAEFDIRPVSGSQFLWPKSGSGQ